MTQQILTGFESDTIGSAPAGFAAFTGGGFLVGTTGAITGSKAISVQNPGLISRVTVDADTTAGADGVQWFEFTVPTYTVGTAPALVWPLMRIDPLDSAWRYALKLIPSTSTTMQVSLYQLADGPTVNLKNAFGISHTMTAGEVWVLGSAIFDNVVSYWLWKKGTTAPTSPAGTYTIDKSAGHYQPIGWFGIESGGVSQADKGIDNYGKGTAIADLYAAYAAPAAPVLSSPAATATSATTASATVSTNTASGTVYCLVNTSATATVSAIKASGVSQTVSATGTQTVAISGLTASTAYYAHFAHNANSLDSTAYDSATFSTPALPAAVLSSPAGTPTSTTTATATVSTTVGSGTLYFMASANSTETATTIKASGASQAVSASGTQNVAFSGLSASTLYYTHFVHVANAQDSNVANGSGFTTPSVSAAVLSSPSASAVANTTATANVTTNTGSGTLYCLASANPTEIVATIKSSGVSKTVTATGAQTFSLTGLTQGTQYYLHFVQTVTGVDSGVSNSSSFTTTAPTVTFTPVCALKAVADGALAANVAIHAFVHDKTTGALVGTKTGLNSGSTAIPPAFTASFGVSGTQYDVKFVDDANALRRSLEAITPV